MEDVFSDMLGSFVNSTTTHEVSVIETVIAEIQAISRAELGSIVILHAESSALSSSECDRRCTSLILNVGFERQLVVDLIRLGPNIPNCLRDFLADPTYVFLVICADEVTEKLRHDYGLVCNNFVELARIATEFSKDPSLREAGPLELGRIVTRYCWDICRRGADN